MKHSVVCVFVAILIWNQVFSVQSVENHQNLFYDSTVDDGRLNMTQLISKYGYPVETHKVQTEDGYILTLFRIPYGRECGLTNNNKVPVLLQHGLLSSSFDFIILGPNKSLGYILADKCYDVWLGNNRGNYQSRNHVSLKPNDKKFWQFTWHEMGKYDLPAMIDYILNTTNESKLHYIGHSQGTTQFFVFGALHPEYHKKIRSMQALSPVAFMKNLASPFVRILTVFQKSIKVIADLIGLYEFQPQISFLNFLGSEFCKSQYPSLQMICSNVVFLLCGFDEPQMNKTMLPAIVSHTPSGSGTNQFLHYAQQIKSGKFRQFDFGLLKNLAIYKSIFPPDYDVKNINIPIAFYYSSNDWLADLRDVKTLENMLPNVIEKYLVPYSKFNHIDFLYAMDAMKLLYFKVLENMEKY